MTIDPIEPELLMPAPRPVRRRVPLEGYDRWQRLSALLLLAALWGFVGWQARDILPHYLHNESAPGEIVEQVIPEGESASVVYRYQDASGEARGRQAVQFEQRPQLHPGAHVTVRVLRFGPWRFSALAVRSPQAFPVLFSGALIALITIVILGYQYGWPRLQRRLFSRGAVVAGLITGTSTFTHRGTNYYINYEFTTRDGRFIRTRMLARKAAFGRAQAGLPATVLYAAGFPRHNLLYDYADFTCRP